MSKAFVKETEDEVDLPDEPPQLPAGIKNYMTPNGHRQLQDELHQLLRAERPKTVETVAWAAGNGDRSENGDYIYGKRRLREIDRRIRFLTKRLENAAVVDPTQQKRRDQVFFGATVTYASERGSLDHGHDRRRRRGRFVARPGQLDISDRPRADQGARRRHRRIARPRRHRADRGAGNTLWRAGPRMNPGICLPRASRTATPGKAPPAGHLL